MEQAAEVVGMDRDPMLLGQPGDQIFEDNGGPWRQRRQEPLPQPRLENRPIDRALDHERRGDAVGRQRGQTAHVRPMVAGDPADHPLAAWGAAMPFTVRRSVCLVKVREVFRWLGLLAERSRNRDTDVEERGCFFGIRAIELEEHRDGFVHPFVEPGRRLPAGQDAIIEDAHQLGNFGGREGIRAGRIEIHLGNVRPACWEWEG
ncbi:MAG: hypothetical protein M3457_20075 [Chloroflexota bacterium]|nr:hypothetical protein [Chloroflexota bacterium]